MAANRDEFLARPADPPEPSADGRWLAPRDRQAGGTWLGVNAGGLFVGVTNRSAGPRDAARRSRGLLVLDALAVCGSRGAAPAAGGLDPSAYNGFHLAYADGAFAGLTWSDGSALRQETLAAGVARASPSRAAAQETTVPASDWSPRACRARQRARRRGLARSPLGALARAPGGDLRPRRCGRLRDAFAFVLHRAPRCGRSAARGPRRARAPRPPGTGPRCSAASAAGSLTAAQCPSPSRRRPAMLRASSSVMAGRSSGRGTWWACSRSTLSDVYYFLIAAKWRVVLLHLRRRHIS